MTKIVSSILALAAAVIAVRRVIEARQGASAPAPAA